MNYTGLKVLVMGLGLHGGGLDTARFMLKRGAIVTVTDLRDETILSQSIDQLDRFCREINCKPVNYILGRHEIDDFKNADIVIKNPAVNPNSLFLQAAKHIETDISLFLNESPAKLFAVTGSKGKSSAASALHLILSKTGRSFLGGNITVSPLNFLDELTENDNVVLELSSWQLGDLKGRISANGDPLLKPAAAVLTAIMPDHLDRYASMDEYVDDKRNIYRGQDSNCITVASDDDWGKSFLSQTKGRPLVYSQFPLVESQSGGWIDGTDGPGLTHINNIDGFTGETVELVPSVLHTPGSHQKLNLLTAALAAYGTGVKAEIIRSALSDFWGIEHRLELFLEKDGIRFYNDSAATIPQAAAACIEALSPHGNLILVTGGTDKNLDFAPIVKAARLTKAIILLAGTGSQKLSRLLDEEGISYSGPFDDLKKAALTALSAGTLLCEKTENDSAAGTIIALSPGCASFGMFLNEFDRGRKWKETIKQLTV